MTRRGKNDKVGGMDYHIPKVLFLMNEVLSRAGFKAYLVGGAVRDTLMGIEAHDYDVATDAEPKDIMRLFHRTIPTGIKHGTVTVRLMGESIETTTFRSEGKYSDGRHPDNWTRAKSIEEDLSRRDFTMNAIAIDLASGRAVDPFHGEEDIRKKVIRAVGDARERFLEDGLRPIRAIRFASKTGFCIESGTYSAIKDKEVLKKAAGVSIERFRDELLKILLCNIPSIALKKLEDTGLLEIFIPALHFCGIPPFSIQRDCRGYHSLDVLSHLFAACDAAPKDNMKVRLAALFHDVGKPLVRNETVDREGRRIITFYNHEEESAKITHKVLTYLRFPNKTVDEVEHLVREHMFHYERNWKDAAVRRFIVRAGRENIEDLFALRRADRLGDRGECKEGEERKEDDDLAELKRRIEEAEKEKNALSLKELAVTGSDVIKAGVKAGPEVGKALEMLLQYVLDEPEMNTKERLLEKVKSEVKKINCS